MLTISNHRRFTANHTWHVDRAGQELFVKANPHPEEARCERDGHTRLLGYYPMPRLRSVRQFARWTWLVYDRWPHVAYDRGLLLDEITHADLTGNTSNLDTCLTAVFGHYRHTIGRTLRRTVNGETVGKLHRDRVAPGGRLDRYYQTNTPWPVTTGTRGIPPDDIANMQLLVNGREYTVDFANLMVELRVHFADHNQVWAAITQGDPTDVNIGWSPAGGPVWFDYDTGGLNALAGEFACFLLYQRLHGAWLTPHYNPAAFRDHPSALVATALVAPAVSVEHDRWTLAIDYLHTPSPARQHVIRRYLDEVVQPIASNLDIDDLMAWLRPYLVMRLLGVYNLAELEARDAALSLALLAQTLHPVTRLPKLLGLTPTRTKATEE